MRTQQYFATRRLAYAALYRRLRKAKLKGVSAAFRIRLCPYGYYVQALELVA